MRGFDGRRSLAALRDDDDDAAVEGRFLLAARGRLMIVFILARRNIISFEFPPKGHSMWG